MSESGGHLRGPGLNGTAATSSPDPVLVDWGSMGEVVKVKDLKVGMVYLDDDRHMLVVSVSENVQTGGSQTYFVVGHWLLNWDTIETHHHVNKGTEFRVVDCNAAICGARTDLNRTIRKCEATLKALPASDHTSRNEQTAEIDRAKATLAEINKAA